LLSLFDTELTFERIGARPAQPLQKPTSSTGMLRAECGYFVMGPSVILGAGIRLDDGSVDPALVHSAEHVFLGRIKTENTAFAKVSVGINFSGHFFSTNLGFF
jgi:hypothetical protein